MKVVRLFLLLFLFLLLSFLGFASEPIKIVVISDTHFLSEKLAENESDKGNYEQRTGRNMVILHEVLDSVFADIVAQKPDFVFVSGDITNHGERQSHLDFAEKLKMLQKHGIQTFVIPGNHDVNVPDSKQYTENEVLPTPTVSASEFSEIYRDFGYSSALKRDTASLSYLAPLNAETWLLCIDSNRWKEYKTSSISAGRILPETLSWALDILREAKEKNITVLAMMHHGLVEHLPYQATFFADYLIAEPQKTAQILADAGLQVVFTGHFHANDITQFTSAAGNTVFDVETGSLSQYPFPYRVLRLNGKKLDIDTKFVESVSALPNLQEVYRDKLEDFALKSIGPKLGRIGIPLSNDTREALTRLLAHISVLHARGDENPDAKTVKALQNMATALGGETFDTDSFELDFPPADNKLEIILR